jgi:hypothetical protein
MAVVKKQIVFVEHPNTTYTYKIARSLKLTKEYETVLITFSKVDKKFFSKAYDKIIVFELSHKVNLKSLLKLPLRLLWKEFKIFLKEIKNLNPFIFQITGPDLFTAFILSMLNKKPKIYFAYDIWAFNDKNFKYKKIQIKEFFQKKIEKMCFKKANGIIHKSAPESLKLLNYPTNKPTLLPGPLCLDEFVIPPKRKRGKEIHIAYAGAPVAECKWRVSFLKIVKEITAQKMYFHTYGTCPSRRDEKLFKLEEEKNPYFHMHKTLTPKDLKKEISKYDYGIVPAFLNNLIIDPRLGQTSVAYKMFDYTEAGIPIILGVPCKFSSKIVEENKIGICVEYKDMKNLKEILNKMNYKEMQENIKIAQEKNRLSKKIKEFERFYELVVNKYNK